MVVFTSALEFTFAIKRTKNGRSLDSGCVRELPRLRRPHRTGQGNCCRGKGGPGKDFRNGVLHPRPAPDRCQHYCP